MTIRFATVADAKAVAALHATRISQGFLVTLGLARSWLASTAGSCCSTRSFVLVADDATAVRGVVGVRSPRTPAAVPGVPGARRHRRRIAVKGKQVLACGAPVQSGRPGATGCGGSDGPEGAEILVDRPSRPIAAGAVSVPAWFAPRSASSSAGVCNRRGSSPRWATTRPCGPTSVGASGSAAEMLVHRGVEQELLVWP